METIKAVRELLSTSNVTPILVSQPEARILKLASADISAPSQSTASTDTGNN